MYPQTPTPHQQVIEHQALSHEAIADYDEAIVVAGSRNFNDYAKFCELLEDWIILEYPRATLIFISGKARSGADDMIIRWCRENGRAWTEYPADWDDLGAPGAFVKRNARGKLYNAAAGHQRNKKMAEAATRALVFWDGQSPGTRNMIEEAEKLGLNPKVLMIDGDREKRNWGNKDGGQEVG